MIEISNKPEEDNSFRDKLKTFLIAFSIWTVLGLSFGSESYLRNYKAGRILPIKYFVIEFLTEFYLYALFSLIVFKLGKIFPLKSGFTARNFFGISFHIFASMIFSIVNVVVGSFIAWTWEDICQDCLTLNMMIDPHFLHRGIVVYWGILIVGKGLEHYRDLNSEKIRVAQLSAQLSDAQLNALKMQIHPHFLFNTLNSIASLIHEDTEAADLMLTRLSDFLRMTLNSSGEQLVTLKTELNFLRTYLEIEKVRFSERLKVEIRADESILLSKVPNFILQPIVENSIKHGLADKKTGCLLELSAQKVGDRLEIEIRDNGKGLDREIDFNSDSGNGLGLSNTFARLKQTYSGNFSFEITGENNKGTLVKFDLPYTE